MGAPGAVQILHGRASPRSSDDAERAAPSRRRWSHEYEDRFANPYSAAERGYVDDVIAATDTRRVLAAALARLGDQARAGADRVATPTPR